MMSSDTYSWRYTYHFEQQSAVRSTLKPELRLLTVPETYDTIPECLQMQENFERSPMPKIAGRVLALLQNIAVMLGCSMNRFFTFKNIKNTRIRR